MDRVIKSARSSGSLNLSNRSLSEVPDEVYNNSESVGKDENWWEGVDLQKLILAHNNLEMLREDLRNLTTLTVLNVSHNKLSSLPSAIGELTLLKSLDVSFNLISNIPEEIGSATSLVKLDCSNNQLKELPCGLGRCSDLSDLKASNNCILTIPEELVHCSKLMKLDLEGNQLTMLSENAMKSWASLTELNAAKNLLKHIPESIGALGKLIRLDFHQNKISSIPSSIMGCYLLTEFYMGTNLLSSLPAELGALSRLSTLDLHTNQIKEYPVEACKLQLSVLDLSNNELTGLPAEIDVCGSLFGAPRSTLPIGRIRSSFQGLGSWGISNSNLAKALPMTNLFRIINEPGMLICTMTTLRKLLLTGNPLRTIRSSLVNGPTPALLKHLRSRLSSEESGSGAAPTKDVQIAMATRLSLSSKELTLSGLGLTNVPPAVWDTDDVVKVDLSRNSIIELPSEISKCSLLQVLLLSGNKIREWPSTVLSSLPNLTCLKLDNNPLSQISANSFEGLRKLEILDISGNPSSLPDPSAFSSLPQLKELYLRRMRLNEIPLSLTRIQQLRILDLSQNSLTSIPNEIKALTSLSELGLSDNNITALPAELGLLEQNLQALRLDGNPLRSIRRAILDRGTKAVLVYLKEKLPNQ